MKKAGLIFFALVFLLLGCASKEESLPPTPTLALPTVDATIAPSETGIPPAMAQPDLLAAILLNEEESLSVYAEASTESALIASLPANAVELQPTGESAVNGEENWLEIQLSTTEAGWVQAQYVTEYIPKESFCADSRVQLLLDALQLSIQNQDAEAFASLVSPTHGLDLRYFRYGTVANYTPAEASWAFKSDYEVIWGNEPDSGLEVAGTFSEIPLPKLVEVFSAPHERICNEEGNLTAFSPQPWLPEYTNINFYQVFKEGSEEYGGLDWRAWLVGVEYINGEPYLFSLIHFEGTP